MRPDAAPRTDRGASTVEQALLTTSIAGVVLAALLALGQSVSAELICVAGAISGGGSIGSCAGSAPASTVGGDAGRTLVPSSPQGSVQGLNPSSLESPRPTPTSSSSTARTAATTSSVTTRTTTPSSTTTDPSSPTPTAPSPAEATPTTAGPTSSP